MIFSSLLDGSKRAPEDDFWYAPIGFSSAGRRVTAESALRTSAVLACVRIISETVGSVPLITYRRLKRGKERASDHSLYKLLRYKPNDRQTALEFWEMMAAHCALRGNAFAEKVYVRGTLTKLIPMHPDQVQVNELDNGRLGYLYTDRKTGQQYRYTEEEIFHLRGLSLDGKLGISIIGYAANQIGVALSADEYGARFFENDATPGGVLTHPNHFADREKREAFKKAWQAANSGANRGKTAVLEDGMKFEQIGVSNRDAQFLESRRFSVEDICRIFRVPLVLVGETSKSTSWGSGVEQFMISFITHTMRPWFVRIEQALQRDFFDDESPDDEYFSEFLAEALLRGDTKARFDAYNSAITNGWMTRNEARDRENMNPLAGLDEPLQPLNMTRANEPQGREERPPAPSEDDPADDDEEDEQSARARQVVLKEVAAARSAYADNLASGLDSFAKWAKRFYGTHVRYVQKQLGTSDDFAAAWTADRSSELIQAAAQEAGGDPVVPALLTAWERDDGRVLLAKLRANP